MSLSLSSLLNPSPQKEEDGSLLDGPANAGHQSEQSPVARRDSLPPISYVQSPEARHAPLPMYVPPQPRQPAAPGLSSIAEQDTQSDKLKDSVEEDAQSRRVSGSIATGGTFELPQPPVGGPRKMSSPKLDQYQVASRSPEQRRTSATNSSGVVLPPLMTISSEGPASQEVDNSHSHATHEPLPANDVTIKLEAAASPQDLDLRRVSTTDQDNQSSKTLNTLKHEHSSHIHSPLRESSIALSTTEDVHQSTMKKRPAPSKPKKGTATATKKPRPLKKRKLDTKTAHKNGSNKGTPGMSSPTPSDAIAEEYDDDDDSMVDSDEDVEGSGDVYCICRKPDNGTFMIGCDGNCDDWFHGKCVGIEERDKNLIDKYICPRCTQNGVGRTSWKRMCRRQGCRLPARVGKNAGKNGATSKYCSDECGVQFFRQMTSSTRNTGQVRKERVSRHKSGTVESGDLGARGGVLSSTEVRAMLDQTNNASEFRELGNGVLSPPATPSGDQPEPDDGMTELEQDSVKTIAAQKEQARQRHQLLKDRLKLITLVKTEANRAAAEKELKPKEYCGFDSRLEWTEEEFAEWRQTPQGQQVFEAESLEIPADATEMLTDDAVPDNQVCSRKKCARHHDWSKLTVDDVRFEMTDNSDHMRSLEQRERDIRDRASLRAKARTFGEDAAQIEVHGLQGTSKQEITEITTNAQADTDMVDVGA